ncbi:hypothetical protein VKT23_000393 [Stygiomarasmius scandens]|uniref:Uncharacterized protein n=1 Tax=Marasmiellus scandens TaxID=2682957 RepID=A0ABR1K4Z4_9AGAR
MSSSPLPTALVAGQPDSSTQAIGNSTRKFKPSLSLQISETDSQPRVSVDLGSPFCGSDLVNTFPVRSPLSQQRPSFIARPPGLYSAFYDSDSDSSEPEKQELEHEQYIFIPSTSPFYNPPSPPSTVFSSDCMSMACQALSERESFNVARMFHEELDRIVPRMDEKALDFDIDCLNGVDEELLFAPMDVFRDVFYNDTLRCSLSPLTFSIVPSIGVSSFDLDQKQLPAIPDDIEADDEDFGDFYDVDQSDDDCSYNSEDSYNWSAWSEADSVSYISLSERSTSPPPRRAIDASPPLDRRLVAPFERDSLRFSVVPQNRFFCGMFSSC